MRRGLVAVVVLGALLLIAPARVMAAAGWSLTATPTTLTGSVDTDVAMRLTDTDASGAIACMRMVIPSGFVLLDSAVVATSAASPWASSASGSGPTTVLVNNSDQVGKLKSGDWVDFRVTVRGEQPGTFGWTAEAFGNRDCVGTSFLEPITISMTVSAPAATPAPTPAPTAQPAPSTPPPTATAVAIVPRSSSVPSSGPGAGAAGPEVEPRLDDAPGVSPPMATSDGSSEGSSAADPMPVASGLALPSALPTARSPAYSTSPVEEIIDGGALAGLALGFETLAVLGDGYAWVVPGMVAGVPGLILLLLVAGQIVLGWTWVPNIGRLLGPEPPAPPDEEQHLWWAAGRPVEM